MDIAPPPRANGILGSICDEAYAQLAPFLELSILETGDLLYDAVGPVEYVHFPTTALISAFLDTANGASGEVALIGSDGALGAMAALCGMRTPFRCVVDRGGHAYHISQSNLQQHLSAGSSLHQAMMRYVTVRTLQMATNSICNLHHSVEQRFCRALLMRLDRGNGDSLFVTHESLGNILGVRRSGVTEVAVRLRSAGAITYTRGRMAVLDRVILQECACECYEAMKTQIARLESSLRFA
jgi:CRP-like cAMP-binding protein